MKYRSVGNLPALVMVSVGSSPVTTPRIARTVNNNDNGPILVAISSSRRLTVDCE